MRVRARIGAVKPAKPRLESGFYTFAEAAQRLGISSAQAYRLDNEGRFPVPVVLLGAVRRVRKADLEAFIGLHDRAAGESSRPTATRPASALRRNLPYRIRRGTKVSRISVMASLIWLPNGCRLNT